MAEHPAEAGTPATRGPTRTYEGDRIRVLWDATRCIHTGICLRGLPEVFDVNARPWVDVTAADAEEIAEVIRACPTGALRYEAKAGLAEEEPVEPTVVQVRPRGPLLVRGRLQIEDPVRREVTDETRVALCRCGASRNKPYCDNSHREVGFR